MKRFLLTLKAFFCAATLLYLPPFLSPTAVFAKQWFKYSIKDVTLGSGWRDVEKFEDGSEKIKFSFAFDMNVSGVIKRLEVTGTLWKREGKFSTLQVQVRSEGRPTLIRARLEGGFLKVYRDSVQLSFELPPGEDLYTPYDVDDLIASMVNRGVTQKSFLLFDPFSVKPLRAQVKIEGRGSLRAGGVVCDGLKVNVEASGIQSQAIFDPDKKVILCEVDSSGISSVMVDGPVKKKAGKMPDLIERFSVPYQGPSPVKFKSVTYRLEGISIESLDLEGFRQKVEGKEITVTLEQVPEKGFSIPYRGSKYRQYLGKEFLIDPHNALVKEAAFSAAGGESDAVKVLKKVIYWTYSNIEKEPVVSVPVPEEVLRTRRGDCNEHAVLAVAMLRALGVPSRVAVGLVYLNGRFYYHAWVEAFVGQWVSADPVRGQIPADVSHIRIASGDMSNWIKIYNLLGKAKLIWVKGW